MYTDFFWYHYIDHRELHILTHPFPTRRSSVLQVSHSLLRRARRVRRHSWRLQGAAPAPGEGGAVHLQRKPELLRSRSQDGYGVGSCRAHDGELTCPIRDSTSMRSEEHTSELQSLMRTSYAVFCLKKKSESHMNTH